VMNTQAAHIQAIVKTAPAIAPGAATATADWIGAINTGLSTVLMALSIAFLLWRWRVAYIKVNDTKKEE
jgi:alpha-beta hydrolase superfamily lysophospholipase